MSRAYQQTIFALTCVMAWLLVGAQNVLAVSATSPPEIASGEFFGTTPLHAQPITPETLQPRRGNTPCGYDIASGRRYWLSPDPLFSVTGNLAELLPEGTNLYSYLGGNPLNGFDPYGLELFGWNGVTGNLALESLNFATGVGDTVTWGGTSAITNGGRWAGVDFGGGLNDVIHGRGIGFAVRSQQGCSGAHTVGKFAGFLIGGFGGAGKAIAKWGANSRFLGKSSFLFGTGKFRLGNGLLNNNNFIRLGWGANKGSLSFGGRFGPRSWSKTSNKRWNNFWNWSSHLNF